MVQISFREMQEPCKGALGEGFESRIKKEITDRLSVDPEFVDDAFEIINNKKLLNKYSYSKAVEELVFNAEINNELINEFQKVLKKLDEISSREKLLIDLVKQLYSDLEIVNLTNPNRNDALKEFFKKRIIGEDD